MPPYLEDAWSDSDEELEDVETSVLLGVPDGYVDAESDLVDAAVSRIGGKPALLSSDVPFDSSLCKHCNLPMELLVQMWCPLEGSVHDRVLYVWGCARGACQRQPGTVRAWRALRYNGEYAAKLEKERSESKLAPIESPFASAFHTQNKANPFVMTNNPLAVQSGLGFDLFVDPSDSITKHGQAKKVSEVPLCDEQTGSDSDFDSIIVALNSVSLSDLPWASAPSYCPLYLSTVSEYFEPEREESKNVSMDASSEGQEARERWSAEIYEESLETDHVFDRFNHRVATEPQQCVRYDLGGTPLPFCTDETYIRLFPARGESITSTPVTKGAFTVSAPNAGRRAYDCNRLPACPTCGERRVFECQLMPNLINVVKDYGQNVPPEVKDTEEERREALEKLLKGKDEDARGMEWGTVLVFTCEKDCCPSVKARWREEHVLVQWDN
ncbi:programmed cell death protein 2 [Vararia minispora EC-137]|uniref:Programmed cell death protein 2 n=1 Tax=Vararia minispora EC-137 TaxID=1314806 RepID=A0ACB8Q8V1_9AGAM|nr:programmed cell death protein 2 [Vararia minispora EC-137]